MEKIENKNLADTLKALGYTDENINKINKVITRSPHKLSNSDILATFDFFTNLGLSHDEIKKITIKTPILFIFSVQTLNDKIDFLQKTIHYTDAEIKYMISSLPALLTFTNENIEEKFNNLISTFNLSTSHAKDIILFRPMILYFSTNHLLDPEIQCDLNSLKDLLIERDSIVNEAESLIGSLDEQMIHNNDVLKTKIEDVKFGIDSLKSRIINNPNDYQHKKSR